MEKGFWLKPKAIIGDIDQDEIEDPDAFSHEESL